MLGGVELLVAGLMGAVVVVGAVAALVARDRRRRNQVVPGTDTGAPAGWAGAHTPEARLHRRLRDAVRAARSVDDPDGALLAARVELERAAIAVDRHLVTLDQLPERLSAGRTTTATSAVAAIESAAASLADTARSGRGVIATAGPGELPAVAAAVERARLLDEAVAELDAIDVTVEDVGRSPRGPVVLHEDPDAAGTATSAAPDPPSVAGHEGPAADEDDRPGEGRAAPG